MSDIDNYLAGVDEATRSALQHVREVVTTAEPSVTEGTSYGMPALKYRGRPLLGFLAAKGHLSIFPFSPRAIDSARSRLDGFSLSKGTIRFSLDKPMPDAVLVDIVRYRVAEIDGAR